LLARRVPLVRALLTFVLASFLTSVALSSSSAHATVPGNNGLIAYTKIEKGARVIYALNSNLRARKRLTDPALNADYPVWSPDGSKIAFIADPCDCLSEQLWVMNADGSGARMLAPDAGTGGQLDVKPSWSPDGTRIAFVGGWQNGEWAIATINADGTGRQNVTAPNAAAYESPAWSPDGSQIAFATPNDLRVVGAGGGAERVVYRVTSGSPCGVSWSPNGASLAFGRCDYVSGHVEVVNIDGSGDHVVANDGGEPAWAPDGAWILFVHAANPGVGESNEIAMVRATGGRIRGTSGGEEAGPGDWQRCTGAAACSLPVVGGRGCTIFGTVFDDEIISGTRRHDVICGLDGSDEIAAGAGNDVVRGGPGDDEIRGDAGNDTLDGGPGWDRLEGGSGSDLIKARDRRRDDVFGNGGRDRAIVDRNDRVHSVEKVVR
jgi:hypothetical protein